MLRAPLLPIYSDRDPARAAAVLDACVDGGVRAFEFTDRADGALDAFAQLRRHADGNAPDLVLGAGTIRDAATAALYLARGAEFIVSPSFEPAIAELCNRRKVAYLPGCATPGEIARAEAHGAEIVKLFPAADLGPDFVKRVLGPMPQSRLLPTGGLTADEATLRAWREAGAVGVGLGSSLIGDADAVARDPAPLRDRCRAALDVLTRGGPADAWWA